MSICPDFLVLPRNYQVFKKYKLPACQRQRQREHACSM